MKELDTTPIYYVYIHFRKDDGLPFYVGKGKGKRAWDKRGRSQRWKNTANKHGYSVGFSWEDIPEEDAFSLEEFLIAQFRSAGYPMVNIVDGWEGRSQKDRTNENKQQVRDFVKETGRFPSSYKTEERQLYIRLKNY